MANVFIVYCHPSDNSFTHAVCDAFVRGVADAGHAYEVSDLYAMGFDPTLSEREYAREAFYDCDLPVPDDVVAEQRKINRCDVIAFIYPVFWTEAPALLTGWFQRVWTYGFAYGDDARMRTLDKALCLVTMGGRLTDAIRREQVDAMKTVMLGDRIAARARSSDMIVFDGMSRGGETLQLRNQRFDAFTRQAYEIGLRL